MITEREMDNAATHDLETPLTILLVCIAGAVAIVAVFQWLAVAEKVRAGRLANATWQSYATHNLLRHQRGFALDTFKVRAADKEAERYASAGKLQENEAREMRTLAMEMEESKTLAESRASTLRVVRGILEIALVLAALATLSPRRLMWPGRPPVP